MEGFPRLARNQWAGDEGLQPRPVTDMAAGGARLNMGNGAVGHRRESTSMVSSPFIKPTREDEQGAWPQ